MKESMKKIKQATQKNMNGKRMNGQTINFTISSISVFFFFDFRYFF